MHGIHWDLVYDKIVFKISERMDSLGIAHSSKK